MSLFKSVIGAIAPVVGGIFGGPAGAALGGLVGGAIAGNGNRSMAVHTQTAPYMQPASALPALGLGSLPQLGRLGVGAVGAMGGMAVRGAGTAMRGAINLCRKYPTWCSTIGGTAAVAAMIESGQLPAPRRRRGRGISSRDLRSYRRVHGILAGFCAPKARIRKPC